jgi:CBS domain containing-hemolysin-like protein
MSLLITILAIALMLAFNALYVAAEFATVGARKSRVQASAQEGNRPASKLLEILKDPVALDNYVAACQVGITLSSLVAGAFGQARLTPLLEPYFGSAGRAIAILITLLIITALQVILGELLPKTAALRYPERLAIATIRPMQISQTVFRPLVAVFNGSAFAIMRALGLKTEHSHAHVHSPEELAALFEESAAGGLIDAAERDMVAGVLHVQERMVREIMTPRRRVVGVRGDEQIDEALARVVEMPHTRFPVWGETTEDVTGIVHLRDLYLRAQTTPTQLVSTITRPVIEVAETVTVPGLLNRLNEGEQHCALVINEYGGVDGLVTLEDAIEEIFGEVRDEFDIDPDPIVVSDGRVSVAGEVLLEDLNHRFDLSLPTDDVDTVGGLVWHRLSRLANVGEKVTFNDGAVVLRVDAVDGNAIERLSFDDPEADQ